MSVVQIFNYELNYYRFDRLLVLDRCGMSLAAVRAARF